MKTIRWGIIGCGDVTERKSGPGFGKAAHSELVAVMRRNGALAADYARRHGVARWHDDAEAIIRADAIGEVRMVTSRQFQRPPGADQFAAGAVPWRVNPELSGGGFFFEGVCHTFDFLDFLFGPITDVRAFAGNQAGAYRPEDIVTATYRFASGAFGSGAWCYTADFDAEYNEIVGAKGRMRFSTSQPVPIRIFHGDAVEDLPVPDPDHVHQPLIQTIVDELNGSGKCPSTGESAARTAHVMEAILAEFRDRSSEPR